MKGRLIVQSKLGVPWPQCVCFLPLDQTIPPGWEELHAVRSLPSDLCTCGHLRSHHVGHRHQCLVLNEKPCPCTHFTVPHPETP